MTEKEELGFKSRRDSNKEKEDQPMGKKVINFAHLETSFKGDPYYVLKLHKNSPSVNRGERNKEISLKLP